MSFYLKLREKMEGKLTERGLELLPHSYQIIGKILLLKLKPELLKQRRLIGIAVLGLLPYLRTVCLQKKIAGKERKPELEFIAGEKSFKTLHRENGCLFEMDVSRTMFSKGNKAEKMRIAGQVKPNETIVDMFAGIGYWAIPVAKFAKSRKVFAIDINPEALGFLERNVFLNNVSGTHENLRFSAEPESEIPCRVEILKGDCRSFAALLENSADRIVMGCLFETEKFLPAALKMAKSGCIIHFHRNAWMEKIESLKKEIAETAEKSDCEIEFIRIGKVKSYAPKVWHVVMDLKVKRR